MLEQLLDSNQLIFKYNAKRNTMSVIQAEYLLFTPFDATEIYIFWIEGLRRTTISIALSFRKSIPTILPDKPGILCCTKKNQSQQRRIHCAV